MKALLVALSLTFAAVISAAENGGVVLPEELVASVTDAADALSKDDLAGYQKHLPAIQKTVKETDGAVKAALLPLSEKLVPGSDLKSARIPFKLFSNTVANFVVSQPKENRQAKVFECPHALKTDDVFIPLRWIQKKDNPKAWNPFWGSKMLHCGKEIQ